jgi:hypothetical protein
MQFLEENWKKIVALGLAMAALIYVRAQKTESESDETPPDADDESKKPKKRPKMAAKK